ncbi:macrophage mannose receptor 1-like [Mytilus trossulus]|uniref:macrophage mannose receptor 1-like n=1 Tax=Mytilus trossulus TaxID=6551 RepID=UPI0030067560
MLNFCYILVVACSLYHVSSAGKLTRQCKESKGKCGVTTDVSCNRMFGPGWVEHGKCCNSRPCCVESKCEDIPNIPNGKVTKTGTSIGSTATFSCFIGYKLRGNQPITCTEDGWSDYPPICYAYPDSIVHFKGSTYKFHYRNLEWLQAEIHCKGQGGNLTSIETEDENNYLKYVANLIPGFWWIGLSDIKTEGSFQWTLSQQLKFTDWYQGPPIQPDDEDDSGGSNADCVLLNPYKSYQWSDEICRIGALAICEF